MSLPGVSAGGVSTKRGLIVLANNIIMRAGFVRNKLC